jgi:hypothetical protein
VPCDGKAAPTHAWLQAGHNASCLSLCDVEETIMGIQFLLAMCQWHIIFCMVVVLRALWTLL